MIRADIFYGLPWEPEIMLLRCRHWPGELCCQLPLTRTISGGKILANSMERSGISLEKPNRNKPEAIRIQLYHKNSGLYSRQKMNLILGFPAVKKPIIRTCVARGTSMSSWGAILENSLIILILFSSKSNDESSPGEFPWTCLILNAQNGFVGNCVLIPGGNSKSRVQI